MKDKKCSGCEEGMINSKTNKSGLCDKCKKDPNKNPKRRVYLKIYYSMPEVKARKKERMKEYNSRKDVKVRMKEYHKNYIQRPEVKKRINELQKKYRQKPKNKLKQKAYQKEYYKTPKFKKYIKKYHQKPEFKKWKYENQKRRLKEETDFRIIHHARTMLRIVLNKYTKEGKIMSSKKYGIDFKAIIEHLKPFPADVSLYHIDHIKPLSKFNFVNDDGTQNLKEIQKAFKPSNHQWMLIKDNLIKSNKVVKQQKLI